MSEKNKDMNYYHTFIALAEDCPVREGVVPTDRGGKPTVATIQYGLLAQQPYTYTQEDILFQTYVSQNGLEPELEADEEGLLRKAFFAKSRACLRTSPLVKKYGWGIHFDTDGKAALVGADTEAYEELCRSGAKVVKGMRSKREAPAK